ncbi:hypothetical protein [Sutcliffiella horikoshii]|uniref:hypothetical protein n=1 Tax=Sutcliffiella horikoshii TaxID=79883 RepID=UPI00384A64E9
MEPTPTINYDFYFNSNEWFIIISLFAGYALIFFLPKRFPLPLSLLFIIIGINSGIVFDHTISIPPFDFYDVNDSSYFELFDFLSYIQYGPYGYLFFYLHSYLKIKGYFNMLYIVVWSIIAMFTEGIATYLGVFHYKEGYVFIYSYPFYFYIQTITLILYLYIMKMTKLPEKYPPHQ